MQYVCKTEGGRYLAVIENDDGERMDERECPSKFAAMQLRDTARNAAVAMFDHIDNPPPPAPPVEAPVAPIDAVAAISKFDHDGDGRPGGSKPKGGKPKGKVN